MSCLLLCSNVRYDTRNYSNETLPLQRGREKRERERGILARCKRRWMEIVSVFLPFSTFIVYIFNFFSSFSKEAIKRERERAQISLLGLCVGWDDRESDVKSSCAMRMVHFPLAEQIPTVRLCDNSHGPPARTNRALERNIDYVHLDDLYLSMKA